MSQPALPEDVLASPFVRSWIGLARPADQFDTNPGRRAASWAHWAISNLIEMTGIGERRYVAVALPGRFYDPRGTAPVLRPHLEIAASTLAKPAPDFPARLAQAGNALLFTWWVLPEVMAVKRAILRPAAGPVDDIVAVLDEHRKALHDALTPLSSAAHQYWSTIEALQVSSPDGLSKSVVEPFDEAAVARYFPQSREIAGGIRVEFDEKLGSSNRSWASRRIGVWRIVTSNGGKSATLGVITPRLTRNSLFADDLFAPARESAAALLVRGLVLDRLLRAHIDQPAQFGVTEADDEPPAPQAPHLRVVVARVGDKIPAASVASAVNFVQLHPDPTEAWQTLSDWAARPHGESPRRAILTVTEDGFKAAHRAAARAIRRAEDPERDDINVILPLAWDFRSRVVRVTFTRKPTEDQTE